MFKPELPNQEQGFTLIEVLVAILIATIFVTVSLQMVVIAAVFKARAKQYSEATTWIQENLEFVRYQASEYEKSASPYSSKCSATNAADGLASGLLTDIGGASYTTSKTIGGKNFTLTRIGNYTSSSDPYKVLNIDYTVAPDDSGSVIASLHTEVIPNAAFNCPAQ
ncbi:prepilin-type N-terminal cleavage/methylation domain-containing protein [Chroococcidiopsis sp. CCMEE 29]|uniref:type IV pilus modification PilV family protein n=1 Tax=Chroococcidiopsis sp. CCMEE 29 TaxID=155894 RepID=UPI00201FE892|nr:prepilin-type N-terminal cleavage/methylation domain-containing protein [Chroococcidiopsis sp. CCMEE 29]